MNMLRIGGYISYEDTAFWDICDELGILVWQDCMLAGFDPPEEPEFVESVRVEVTQQLARLEGRPSLTVVCGSSETHQQAAMFGLPDRPLSQPTSRRDDPGPCRARSSRMCRTWSRRRPAATCRSSPARGSPTTSASAPTCGPVADARAAGVRFAAECLSFGNPPEQSAVERASEAPSVAGHHPTWKAGVARDSGTSWDFEDVRDDYVRQIFGVDPFRIRYTDPERYLDLRQGRRRPPHVHRHGGVALRPVDLRGRADPQLARHLPRGGVGLARLRSPLRSRRGTRSGRVLAPVGVLLTDEGLAGLRVHVINDQASTVAGRAPPRSLQRGRCRRRRGGVRRWRSTGGRNSTGTPPRCSEASAT